jgi:PAS domain S-box-containing protein
MVFWASSSTSPILREAIEEAVPTGIAAIDQEGRQTYVNESFCRMVGYRREELLGQLPPFAYWPPGEVAKIQDAFTQTLRGEAPTGGCELRFRRQSGEVFDVLVASRKDGSPASPILRRGSIRKRDTKPSSRPLRTPS